MGIQTWGSKRGKKALIYLKVVSTAVENNLGSLVYMHHFATAIKASFAAIAAEHYDRVDSSEYSNLFQDQIIELIGEFVGTCQLRPQRTQP